MINNGTVTNSNTIVASSGSNTLTAPVEFINDGVVEVLNGATETINAPLIAGTGSMQISTGGDLILNAGSIQATQTIVFTDATGLLTIGTSTLGGFGAKISGFQPGDQITVQTTVAAKFSQIGSIVVVSASGVILGDLTFASVADASQAVSTNGGLNDQVLCFCAGTYIATPTGETLVEGLAVGDEVATHRGEARRITWIGVGRVLATRGQRSDATPVIIRRGALADNVPHQDLRVTKGHSFFIDDILIPAEYLINHHSILWDDRAQEVELYHIELASHDVLLANGAPAETYRDDGNRWLFQNANSGWGLPPQPPCASVLTGGPMVDAIWRRLLERVEPRKSLPLTGDPDLHLQADGQRIDAIEQRGDIHVFRLGTRPRSVRICSRAAVPQELRIARDDRSLGVAIRRITLAHPKGTRAIEADAAALTDGYHAFEPENDIRWTDGNAAVPGALFAGLIGPCLLMLHLGGATQYLDDGGAARVA